MNVAAAPLRILMVIHTPWSRNLGASRVPMELAEEFRDLGDEVEKFSYEDAFPEKPRLLRRGVLRTLGVYLRSNRSFAAKAQAFVRENRARFDIVDANQTDLPVSKSALGMSGLLVARSVGLIPAYMDFERMARNRWGDGSSSRDFAHKLLTYPGRKRRHQSVEPSFRYADLINVSNSDDLETVGRWMGDREKVVYFPFGLSKSRLAAFAVARPPTNERLSKKTVAFIGTWNSRKGARDWPTIFKGLQDLVPNVKLLLLGTGLSAENVLKGFPEEARGAVRVISSYESEHLPRILASATVGAFPGYLEGFGFGTLEMLAAGLPTVAYDAPGSRDILARLKHPTMVPAGDTEAFTNLLAQLLTLKEEHYGKCADESIAVASTFAWRDIAVRTREVYVDRLMRLRKS